MKQSIAKNLFMVLASTIVLGGAGCVSFTPSDGTVPPSPVTPAPVPAPAPTPTPTPSPTPSDCSGPGDSCGSGYTCIQKCGPPVARDTDPPPGYYCETNAIAAQPRMCPICLASNTMIATPNGEVNVRDVTTGSVVWSQNALGERVSSVVLETTHTPVLSTHQVVHLVLADEREVWVSPNHPTATGQLVGSLRAGDTYDGTTVRVMELVPYWDNETFDLLPDSETGTYWADGILLGSTLSRP